MVTGSTGRSGPCVLPVPNRVLWLSAIWAGRAAGSKTKIKEASGRSLKLCSDSEWNFGELQEVADWLRRWNAQKEQHKMPNVLFSSFCPTRKAENGWTIGHALCKGVTRRRTRSQILSVYHTSFYLLSATKLLQTTSRSQCDKQIKSDFWFVVQLPPKVGYRHIWPLLILQLLCSKPRKTFQQELLRKHEKNLRN